MSIEAFTLKLEFKVKVCMLFTKKNSVKICNNR